MKTQHFSGFFNNQQIYRDGQLYLSFGLIEQVIAVEDTYTTMYYFNQSHLAINNNKNIILNKVTFVPSYQISFESSIFGPQSYSVNLPFFPDFSNFIFLSIGTNLFDYSGSSTDVSFLSERTQSFITLNPYFTELNSMNNVVTISMPMNFIINMPMNLNFIVAHTTGLGIGEINFIPYMFYLEKKLNMGKITGLTVMKITNIIIQGEELKNENTEY